MPKFQMVYLGKKRTPNLYIQLSILPRMVQQLHLKKHQQTNIQMPYHDLFLDTYQVSKN